MVADNPKLNTPGRLIKGTYKDPCDRRMMEDSVKVLLSNMNLDISEEGLKETPRRVVDFLLEFRNMEALSKSLGTTFDSKGHDSMVTQNNIPFRMLCEHHLAPAIGRAMIGYVPNKKVVGLSKLTRLVQSAGTRRPSLQEYICDNIANVMHEVLEPKGVIVVIKAEHTCMACRGVNTPGIITTTSSLQGIFRDVPQARAEFFSLVGG